MPENLTILSRPMPRESRDEKQAREAEWLAAMGINPELQVVKRTPEAAKLDEAFRTELDQRYKAAESAGDNASMGVWGRASEQCHQFALDYALSGTYLDYESEPWCFETAEITADAVAWAIKLTQHICAQKLYAVRHRRPESEFTRKRAKVVNALREGQLTRRLLIKNSHLSAEELFGHDARNLGGVVGTLVQSGEIKEIKDTTPSKNGRVGRSYTLIGKVES